MATDRAVDREKLEKTVEHIFGLLGGAVVSAMIYLGDRLGLYRALADAGTVSSEELALKTGLDERWLREWLRGQAAARVIDYAGDGRFALSPEGEMVLADESSPAFSAGGFSGLPAEFAVLEKLPESFRTGLGLPYDAFGEDGNKGVERLLAPWFRNTLVPVALPALDGVVAKLEAGAKVADVGCGGGVALLEMARSYPSSPLPRLRHLEARSGPRSAEHGGGKGHERDFHDANGDAIPNDASFDLITTFDCIHDMANPSPVMHAIRRALREDGTWLIADIKCKPTFEENLEDNPWQA